MTPKATRSEVSAILMDICILHRNAALEAGLDFLQFIMDAERREKMVKDQETACILMGWTLEEHSKAEHEAILAEMQKEIPDFS